MHKQRIMSCRCSSGLQGLTAIGVPETLALQAMCHSQSDRPISHFKTDLQVALHLRKCIPQDCSSFFLKQQDSDLILFGDHTHTANALLRMDSPPLLHAQYAQMVRNDSAHAAAVLSSSAYALIDSLTTKVFILLRIGIGLHLLSVSADIYSQTHSIKSARCTRS